MEKHIQRSILRGLLLLVCPFSAAHGEELTVGKSADFATVQEAVNAASPGDNIVIHDHEDDEKVTLTTDGTEDKRIVLSALPDVVFRGRIVMRGNYWDVSDLTIIDAGDGDSDTIRIQADHNRLLRLDISGGNRDGIDGGGNNNQVLDSLIHNFDAGDSDAHCIVLNPGAENWTISGNQLFDCSGDGIQLFSQGPERTILNTRIENNDIYYTGSIKRTENALDIKNANGLVIAGNRMFGFDSNKVVVFQKAPANIDMHCNQIYSGANGIEFRGEDGGIVENVNFSNNLIYGIEGYALKFDDAHNATVFHNTFVDIGSDGLRIEGEGLQGGALQNNLWVRTGNIDGGSFDADHNGFFAVKKNAIASSTNVNADPILDDQRKITPGSPMENAGIDVGLPFADTAPDLGAHEIGEDPCSSLNRPIPNGKTKQNSGCQATTNTTPSNWWLACLLFALCLRPRPRTHTTALG